MLASSMSTGMICRCRGGRGGKRIKNANGRIYGKAGMQHLHVPLIIFGKNWKIYNFVV